jgi:hypothetical protein
MLGSLICVRTAKLGPGRPRVLVMALTAAAIFAGAASAATTAGAPVNGCPPPLEGTAVVGKTLTAGNGCWSNSPTSFTYKWVRCDQKGGNCVAISGATKQSYTLTSADLNHTVVVFVTASNTAGSTGPVNSKPSAVVSAAAPPVFQTRPSITGKTQVGETLAAKVGTFSGGIPTKFAFQWQRCDKDGQNCVNVSGATSETYGVRTVDVDNTLRVKVTASNDYGTVSETSDRTQVVTSIPQPIVATTTISASRSVTTCCQRVRLSGTVSTQKAGVTVIILGREVDDLADLPVATATTDATGAWAVTVRPSVKTTYRAQVGTAPTAGVTVNVRPRVGLGINGRRWTVKVTGRDSFAGSLVFLQRRAGSHWVTVGRVVLNLTSVGHFVSRAHHAHWTIRAFVPSRETGPGYMAGVSNAVSIRI